MHYLKKSNFKWGHGTPTALTAEVHAVTVHFFMRYNFYRRCIMAEIQIKCAICGQAFISHTRNACYCSADCRRIGRGQKRKQWEDKTNYRELQRSRMKSRRELKAPQQIKSNPQKSVVVLEKRKSRKELIEFWENYKQDILESESPYFENPTHTVGGIDIHDVDFVEKVVQQLRG